MKATNAAQFNLKTFHSKLQELAFKSLDYSQREKKLPLDALALHLATSLVEIINSNTKYFKPYLSHLSASEIFETIRKLVLRLIAENGIRFGHPFETLDFAATVDAYECLLDQRLSVIAGKCSIVSSANEKRRRGVFYTPDELARELTTMALRPLVLTDTDCSSDGCEIPASAGSLVSVEKLLALKIVDPAMGVGTFLLTALDVLADCVAGKLKTENCESDWSALCRCASETNAFFGTVKELRKLSVDELHTIILQTIARSCLYGLDLDVAAVQLAKIGLARKCRLTFSEAYFPNLRNGNALIGLWSSPEDSMVSAAIKKLSDAGLFLQSTSRSAKNLSEEERRNLVCLQFFPSLILSSGTRMSCERLRESVKLFHWGLEFEEVFSGDNPGFDLVLTNPPWEIEKANSREFFTRYDAEYMSLSKQAALVRQQQLIAQDKTIQNEWNGYLAFHEGLSEFLQRSAGLLNHAVDTMPPFSFQGGSDANSYKLFLELGYHLLKTNGVMAQIVPSGFYSDKGATELRRLFLGRCRWDFLNGYHNHEGIFSIHRSFKFCTLGVIKGGCTEKIKCRFLKVSPDAKEKSIDYHVSTINQLSPENLALTEFPEPADVALVQRLANNCTHLGAMQSSKNSNHEGGEVAISFRREFDMTNDSKLFVERSAAQNAGFVLDTFGHWLKGSWRLAELFDSKHTGEFVKSADGEMAMAIDDIQRVLLPVYEGRMIGQYDWAKKAWLHGKGRRADWAELPFDGKQILPQYLMELDTYLDMQPERGAKVAYLAVGAATNSRSCIAALIGDWPCGNAVPVLSIAADHASSAKEEAGKLRYGHMAGLLACLNSYVFDYLLRLRLSANNLNWFILKECLVPDLRKVAQSEELLSAVYELSAHDALRSEGICAPSAGSIRRMKLRAFVEAFIADAYSVEDADCQSILRGCDLGNSSAQKYQPSSIDKGFHRVDLHLPSNMRGPYLFYQGLMTLKERGAGWFFENIDRDDVLFSRDQFFDGLKNSVGVQASYLPPDMMHHREALKQASADRESGCDDVEFDFRRLMTRIRNAGLKVSRF